MRMSCNGCRVLRKGCSDDCVIRPCLLWIKSPEAQANATMFLAKFYGRAGLINLINAGAEHLRPAIFRSLLYEACGRIINPIYGSVGLLWSGKWSQCQSTVDSVLKGSAHFMGQASIDSTLPFPALKPYDIRHVPKTPGNPFDLHKVRTRNRFKRSAATTTKPAGPEWLYPTTDDSNHDSTWMATAFDRDSPEAHSVFSVETVEDSLACRSTRPDRLLRFEPNHEDHHSRSGGSAVKLELTLGVSGPSLAEPSAVSGACKGEMGQH